MSFFVTLQSNFQHVMLYENPELQQKARSYIPHQQLSSDAEHKLNKAKEADPGEVLSLVQKNQFGSGSDTMQIKTHVFLLNSGSEGPTDLLSCL